MRSSGGGALTSQRLAELKLRMEVKVNSGVGRVSGRAGGWGRGLVRSVLKSGWGGVVGE
jgi:hypothetical protein